MKIYKKNKNKNRSGSWAYMDQFIWLIKQKVCKARLGLLALLYFSVKFAGLVTKKTCQIIFRNNNKKNQYLKTQINY
jgi:hypothetical protein